MGIYQRNTLSRLPRSQSLVKPSQAKLPTSGKRREPSPGLPPATARSRSCRTPPPPFPLLLRLLLLLLPALLILPTTPQPLAICRTARARRARRFHRSNRTHLATRQAHTKRCGQGADKTPNINSAPTLGRDTRRWGISTPQEQTAIHRVAHAFVVLCVHGVANDDIMQQYKQAFVQETEAAAICLLIERRERMAPPHLGCRGSRSEQHPTL